MMDILTEKEKEKIKRRLERHCALWSIDRLQDTYDLIDAIRTGEKERDELFIDNGFLQMTNEQLLGELLLLTYI